MSSIKSVSIAVLGILAFAISPVRGAPVASEDRGLPPRNQQRGLVRWRGVLDPGRPEFVFNGSSYDDIERQVKALNSNYSIFEPELPSAEELSAELARRGLEERQAQTWRHKEVVTCGGPLWYPTPQRYVHEGILYLMGLKGMCGVVAADDTGGAWDCAGPGYNCDGCSRVSCHHDSAIFYCNEDPSLHSQWEQCKRLGHRALAIWSKCVVVGGGIRFSGSDAELYVRGMVREMVEVSQGPWAVVVGATAFGTC